MRVTILKEIPEDATLASAWNGLVMRMDQPEVFFTYEWALAASRAFRDTVDSLLFLVYEGEDLCGVAAMATANMAIAKKQSASAFFLNASTADYCDIVSIPEKRDAVLASLLQELRTLGMHRLVLANLPSDSPTLKELAAISRKQHFHIATRPAYQCGLIEFGSEDQRSVLLNNLTRKSREQRALKRLSRIGAVQITHLSTPEEIDRCLPQVFAAQVSRFLATARISPLINNDRRLFLRELAGALSRAGWLKISQLEVNRIPVAWNYGFRFGESWFWYLPSFRVEYEDYSPGSCLLRLLVEEGCADRSLRRFDLGLGEEAYKSRFTTTVRPTSHVDLSSNVLRHTAVSMRQALTIGLARFPQAADRIRRARDVLRAQTRRLKAEGLRATMAQAARRVVRLGGSRDEVLFFEGLAKDLRGDSDMRLSAITSDDLADAAMSNNSDPDTLQYLLRAAARLRHGKACGFLLRSPDKQAVHFLAEANLEGFHLSEIDYTLTAVDPGSTLIFDCWTPQRFRGHGFYPLAIRQAAVELLNEGKRPWIFCAASNTPSVRGILKAGFVYRHSLVRQRRLGHSTSAPAMTQNSLYSTLPPQ